MTTLAIAPVSVDFASAPPGLEQRTLPCVLVVDDDWDVRHSLTGYLQRAGITAVAARDAVEAMDYLDAASARPAAFIQPDIIVTDRRMAQSPEFRMLSRLAAMRDIPTVLIAAFGGPDLDEDPESSRPVAVADAPFDIVAFCGLVRRIVAEELADDVG